MKIRFLPFALLLPLIVSACGSGSGSNSSGNGAPTGEKATEKGLLNTAEAYYSASIKSPAKLYDFFTSSCKEVLSKEDFLGQILIGTSMFEGLYGFKLSEVKFSNVRLSNVTENSGQSQADAVGPDGTALDSSEIVDWVYEDGAWRTSNDCDLSEDGNADSGNSGSPSDSELRPAAEVKEVGISESAIASEVKGTGSCLLITTPIREIKGFRNIKRRCVADTFSGNHFTYVSTVRIPGTDLSQEDAESVENQFRNLSTSLGRTWTWGSQDKVADMMTYCQNVYDPCEIYAYRTIYETRRYSVASFKIEWLPGACIRPPYCGGWYSSYYRMKITVHALEEFWE